jgi:hypothetical protein
MDLVLGNVWTPGLRRPRTESATMGNHQQNQEPRHEQPHREGQRLGGNHQGGKADESETALDQGGQGKGREPRDPADKKA